MVDPLTQHNVSENILNAGFFGRTASPINAKDEGFGIGIVILWCG